MEAIWKSTQVIIVDNEKHFYLEEDETWNIVNFYWWNNNYWEMAVDTAIRELNQKLGIIIWEQDLILLDLDINEEEIWICETSLFLLKIDKTIKNIIKKYRKLVITSIENFDWLTKNTISNRIIFKKKMQMALEN